ncbi:MAG: NAD(P)/FAD-dependent oxidoreductase [Candidatus Bathyarchaeota archaeon]
MTKSYDIIVVGAGPAGSIAAKMAAEKGLKTLIFERGKYLGQKSVGGELLPISIFKEFPWMKKGPVERAINKWSFFLPYEDKCTEFCYSRREEYGYTVHRPKWDFWVGQFAKEAGATVKTSTLVKNLIVSNQGAIRGVVTDKGEKFYSKIVIGADGVNSIVSRRIESRKNWSTRSLALCVKYTFSLPSKEITKRFSDEIGTGVEIFYGKKICPRGFAWMFPSKEDFCIGIGCGLDTMKHNMFQYLQNVIKLPQVKRKIRNAKLAQYSAHLVPIYETVERTYGNGVLLTGDAAGFACPFDGAGYEAAAVSGRIAAEVAEEAINSGDTSSKKLRKYETTWKNSYIAGDLQYGQLAQDYILKEVGLDTFNRMMYEIGTTIMKHGCFVRKSHADAIGELMTKYAPLFLGFLTRLAPLHTLSLEEVMKAAFQG